MGDNQNVLYPYDIILFAMKKKKALIQAKIWMDIESIKLNQRIQSQKITYYIAPFIKLSRLGKSIEILRRLLTAGGCGRKE